MYVRPVARSVPKGRMLLGRQDLSWPEGQPHVANVVSLPEMAAKVQEMLAIVGAFTSNTAPETEHLMRLERTVAAVHRMAGMPDVHVSGQPEHRGLRQLHDGRPVPRALRGQRVQDG